MKTNSYQKLKLEIRQLKDDINTLVNHPSSMDARMIIERHKLSNKLENAIFMGNASTKSGKYVIDGIINKII